LHAFTSSLDFWPYCSVSLGQGKVSDSNRNLPCLISLIAVSIIAGEDPLPTVGYTLLDGTQVVLAAENKSQFYSLKGALYQDHEHSARTFPCYGVDEVVNRHWDFDSFTLTWTVSPTADLQGDSLDKAKAFLSVIGSCLGGKDFNVKVPEEGAITINAGTVEVEVALASDNADAEILGVKFSKEELELKGLCAGVVSYALSHASKVLETDKQESIKTELDKAVL